LVSGVEAFYCLFCETGSEGEAERDLSGLGLRVVSARAERNEARAGRKMKIIRQLLPGYVFFQTEEDPDRFRWKSICASKHIYYPIGYADGTKRLRGGDLEFVRWLLRRDGIVGVSKAFVEGKKVRIIDGPLKEFEGKIVAVNKKRQYAKVEVESFGIIRNVWLPYEVVSGAE
jgi:transcriptional antiterminator NusG